MHDRELDQFKRDINLVEYAIDRYGYRRLPRESSRSSHVLVHEPSHDKILVTRQPDGHWVYCSVRDDRDQGTVVDFVQRRRHLDLGRTRQELRDWLRTPRPDPGPTRRPECPPVTRDREAVTHAFARAYTPASSAYLNGRGLLPETLHDARFAGTWKEDARGNTLFPHRDEQGLCGFEIKNHGFTGFAAGGHKALWHSVRRPADTVLIVTESAIDAMSYQQLHRLRCARYVSTAGSLSRPQTELISRTFARLPPQTQIVAAVDADARGATIAATIAQLAAAHTLSFVRHEPAPGLGKDWNEALQRLERDLLASLDNLPRRRAPEHAR